MRSNSEGVTLADGAVMVRTRETGNRRSSFTEARLAMPQAFIEYWGFQGGDTEERLVMRDLADDGVDGVILLAKPSAANTRYTSYAVSHGKQVNVPRSFVGGVQKGTVRGVLLFGDAMEGHAILSRGAIFAERIGRAVAASIRPAELPTSIGGLVMALLQTRADTVGDEGMNLQSPLTVRLVREAYPELP